MAIAVPATVPATAPAAEPAPAAGGTAVDAAGTAGDAPSTSFTTRPGELIGRVLRFRGSVSPERAGSEVLIQRRRGAGDWRPTATAVIAADGSFIARWRTDEPGRFTVRLVLAGADALAASTPPTAQVTIYRRARATWYGPGFYGRRTACGERMTKRLLGVAHRTLPCGTPVELFFGGRSITVPVVDRGPFTHIASYDLTSAAATAIGMAVTTTIGVAPRRGSQMTAKLVPAAVSAMPGTGGAIFSGA